MIFRSECIGILGQGSRERRRLRGEKRERPGAVQDENVKVLPSKTSIAPVKSTAVNPDPAYLLRLELCGISISIRLNLDFSQIRETAQPSPYKFIEFYDIRAAEAALSVLNRFDGGGKQQIKVELSRPSGARQCLKQAFYTGLEHDDLMKLISPSMNSAGRNGSVPLGAVGSLTNGNNMGAHTFIRAPISPFAETSFHHGVSNSLPKSSPSLEYSCCWHLKINQCLSTQPSFVTKKDQKQLFIIGSIIFAYAYLFAASSATHRVALRVFHPFLRCRRDLSCRLGFSSRSPLKCNLLRRLNF
ncbi:hypothetical protein QQ045_001204 [Rhodiola kirilowii]